MWLQEDDLMPAGSGTDEAVERNLIILDAMITKRKIKMNWGWVGGGLNQ